jgi:Fe-S cluster biogenesis protein NfuA
MSADKEFRQRMRRIESLVEDVERFADPKARESARGVIQELLELHRTGIDHVLEHVAATGPAGLKLIESMAGDDVVSSLLLLHGLHPLDFEQRVGQALEQVRPYLRSHGGNVELLALDSGVVRLRMQGSCHGCPSSAVTLKTAIEEAIYEHAPDVVGIEVEAATEATTAPANGVPHDGFVSVDELFHRRPAASAAVP